MRLTAKELEQMKSVDIGAVAPESLPDVSGMAFDTPGRSGSPCFCRR